MFLACCLRDAMSAEQRTRWRSLASTAAIAAAAAAVAAAAAAVAAAAAAAAATLSYAVLALDSQNLYF